MFCGIGSYLSAEHPLSKTGHFVAGVILPEREVEASACDFEVLYASLGVAIMATVVDGDCAMDVMTLMLGKPPSFSFRKDLRIELSDYLIARIGEPWLHDIMIACQELRLEDAQAFRSGVAPAISLAVPTTPAPAVADLAMGEAEQKDAAVTPTKKHWPPCVG